MFGVKTKIKNFIQQEVRQTLAELVCPSPPPLPDPLAGVYDILARRHNLAHTIRTKIPTAPDGSPIPWYTFPAIEYFRTLDARGLYLFEYSCGHSTLFWARKGANIWCVEHNPEWYETMYVQAAAFNGIMLREEKVGYANAVHEPNIYFDIISIDGVWRNECAVEALKCLKPGGIIILDNSDWYTDVAQMLRNNNFFQVDFNGFGPCNDYCWTTSLMLPMQSYLMSRWRQPAPIGGICVQKDDRW